MKGYEALREGAAWIDLRGRAFLLVHGEDRKRLLHAMTTNHVQQLEAGVGLGPDVGRGDEPQKPGDHRRLALVAAG